MKKHILLGAALLSLMATSCSNDDVIDNGTAVVTGKTITLNATINNGADTRMTYTDDGSSKMSATWSTSESFTMYKGTSGTGSTFTKTAESDSKFKGDDITGIGKYYAVYGEGISNTDGTLTIDLSQAQVGTSEENGIKEFMLASADALGSETTLTFDHKLTVLKMTLTLPSDVEGTVSKVTVSGLHNKATYTLGFSSYTYIDDDKGDITATNGSTGFAIADNKITAYVAVFPEAVDANQVTIKAAVGDNEYSYTIATARNLEKGKVVPVRVTLAAPVQKNFKSAYTADDYKTWSEDNCKNAPTVEQMEMYLGAGVYWDDGSTSGDGYYNGNVQTYTVGVNTYHAGLWVMKKAYIDGFSAGSAQKSDSATPTSGRPSVEEINKYFFLPAAGYYYDNFYTAGSYGNYWLSSSDGDVNAYCLGFYDSGAFVGSGSRNYGILPMAAE